MPALCSVVDYGMKEYLFTFNKCFFVIKLPGELSGVVFMTLNRARENSFWR